MAAERQSELVPNPAMGAIAARQVVRGDHARLPGHVLHGRGDTARVVGEANQLGLLLDHAAKFGDPRAQKCFSLMLRNVEHEPEARSVASQIETDPALSVGVEGEPADGVPTVDEAVGYSHEVQDLECAGVDHDGPGLQVHPIALVNDSRCEATRQQVRGEHQARGPGADHKDLAVRPASAPGSRCNRHEVDTHTWDAGEPPW